jgi:CBS domain-containing protein
VQTIFPVVDAEQRLVGVLTMADLGRVARDHRDDAVSLTAADVAAPSVGLGMRDSLLEAIRRMGVHGAAALPVVEAHSGRLIGLISRAHILGLYERSVAKAEGGNHRR